jgi:hypothetical protein
MWIRPATGASARTPPVVPLGLARASAYAGRSSLRDAVFS